MSLTAAAIRMLADKGFSASEIADLAEANTRTQSAAAVRQKRYRDNKRDVTRDVTVPPNDIDIYPPPPDTPVISNEMTAPADDLKPEHVVEAWNVTAERLGLSVVRKLTPERRRKLATRIRQNTIDDFTEAIAAVERSSFLRGENDRGWRADFNWMLEPKNFTKLIEGTYDR